MIRIIEDNPVAVVLIAFSAVLLFASLMLAVVWSLPPTARQQEQVADDNELSLDVPELANSEPIARYAVITERPVFNPSRRPEVMLDTDEEDMEDEPEEDVDAPDVELAGVIITPSIRMATLKQKDDSESLVAFEGQPLQGDYGSWHVSNIEPRRVTLSSGQGEEFQLSLVVHDQAIEAPAASQKQEPESAAPDESEARRSDSDQPLTRAEEIRQRIAERREELRRAAEENAEDATEPESGEEFPRYQSVMERAIANQKKQQNKDENEK